MRHAEELPQPSEVVTTGVGILGRLYPKESTNEIERSCLDLCISLLDHDMRSNIYESVVIGFLAMLGIDSRKRTFKEAYHYTPSLSGFIKIAQMLVI